MSPDGMLKMHLEGSRVLTDKAAQGDFDRYVSFLDQLGRRKGATLLELLGDREHKAERGGDDLLSCLLVTAAGESEGISEPAIVKLEIPLDLIQIVLQAVHFPTCYPMAKARSR